MGARSGSNYLSTLKKLNAEVWFGGERVAEVTSHPAFRNCARSLASLYDMQLERPEQMTYRTDDGGRSGLSFIQPKTADELRKRSRMMAAWANFSGGMLGRTPDYLNTSIAAMAAARDFFAAGDPRFGDNIANYYLEARKHDWCATLTSLGMGTRIEQHSDGVIVNGTGTSVPLAPFAEELLVLPSPALGAEPAAEPFALAFAMPCNTKGLRFICRDSFFPHPDNSRSHFDAPLASRFEEMDCVVIFDEVKVPWERVFLCGDVARCNALCGETNAVVHMMHQAVIKDVAKSEFLLGLAVRIAEVTDALTLPHVRERIAEMITTTETMRACLRAAEADAAVDKWGIFAPARPPLETACNLFPRLYPQMVEIIQLSSTSHLMVTPSERDFASAINADIEKYYAAGGADVRERVALYRLAWDVAGSAFAGRQVLYERSFFGDPVRMASALVDNADLASLTQRIKDFLNRTD